MKQDTFWTTSLVCFSFLNSRIWFTLTENLHRSCHISRCYSSFPFRLVVITDWARVGRFFISDTKATIDTNGKRNNTNSRRFDFKKTLILRQLGKTAAPLHACNSPDCRTYCHGKFLPQQNTSTQVGTRCSPGISIFELGNSSKIPFVKVITINISPPI